MEVRFKPETESRLNELASKSGRPADALVEDAMAGYLEEIAEAARHWTAGTTTLLLDELSRSTARRFLNR